MNVAHLFGSLNRGGTETLMLDVFGSLTEQNISVIGIYRNGGVLLDDFKSTGIKMHLIKPRFVLDVFYLLRLRKYLQNQNINIVHTHQAIDALYAWLACRGGKTKIVLTFHGFNTKYGGKLRRITKFIINRTDMNVFVSHTQQILYNNTFGIKKDQKQIVIYNGISLKKFNNPQSNSLQKQYNISKGTLKLGTVGNFVSGRDQMTICRFLGLLKDANIEFVFFFVGAKSLSSPQLYDECVDYCNIHKLSDCVHFLGSRDDVPDILQELDAFIYSTAHDTFGIAVIEAIASETPVFYNDEEVLCEISQNGKLGFMYKSMNENDLFQKFKNHLKQNNKSRQKAQEDANFVKQIYNIETHINNLKRAYSEIYDF